MPKSNAIVLFDRIQQAILIVRGERIILDADLAALYGVTTKRLNEQVRRNRDRFPEDFAFRLSWEEVRASRSQFATLNDLGSQGPRPQTATLKRGRNVKYRPYAFTEHGAIMAANVLNSERAVRVSVLVVRTFVRLRGMLAANKELAGRLDELERKVAGHDGDIRALVEAIRQLMAPPPEPARKRIGFRT